MKRQRPWGSTEEKEENTADNEGQQEPNTHKKVAVAANMIKATTDDPVHENIENENVLSPEDISNFQEKGFVLVKGGFAREDAQQARKLLWERLASDKGIHVEDPSTWVKRIGIPECFVEGAPWNRIIHSRRVKTAIDQLCGKNRWKPFGLGWWVISFPNQEEPPWGASGKWHVDGAHYRHHINSQESGLLPIFCFSAIRPKGGGTALCVGSHKVVAKILMDHEPKGLQGGELSHKTLEWFASTKNKMVVEELQATEGDVLLTHPFLLHARSKNLGTEGKDSVRFMCNPNVELKAPMQFPRKPAKLQKHAARHYEQYTPVERAIVDALMNDV